MMSLSRITKEFKGFHYHESGFTLVEALTSLAILGMFAAVFFTGLSIASRADFIVGEQSNAASLAQSQMEHIKTHGYIDYADPGHGEYELITAAAGYSIEVTTLPIDPSTGESLDPDQDNGVQRITVTVRHQDEPVTILESYKVDR